MVKLAFNMCENKSADQLCSNCTADQRLCFRFVDSTSPRLPKSQISIFLPPSVTVQVGSCQIWLETPNAGFLMIGLQFSAVMRPRDEEMKDYR